MYPYILYIPVGVLELFRNRADGLIHLDALAQRVPLSFHVELENNV